MTGDRQPRQQSQERVPPANAVRIERMDLAVPGRLESYHACFDAVARERCWILHTQAPPLDEVRAFIERGAGAGAHMFVALLGDEVIGWCDVFPGTRAGTTHAAVLGMGVAAAHRGHGIGRRLMDAAMAAAEAAGLQRVELQVYAHNHVARRLYDAASFELEGVRRRARLIDGRYDDMIVMARLFGAAADDVARVSSKS